MFPLSHNPGEPHLFLMQLVQGRTVQALSPHAPLILTKLLSGPRSSTNSFDTLLQPTISPSPHSSISLKPQGILTVPLALQSVPTNLSLLSLTLSMGVSTKVLTYHRQFIIITNQQHICQVLNRTKQSYEHKTTKHITPLLPKNQLHESIRIIFWVVHGILHEGRKWRICSKM